MKDKLCFMSDLCVYVTASLLIEQSSGRTWMESIDSIRDATATYARHQSISNYPKIVDERKGGRL